MFLWLSTKEAMLCPPRFVVDATENNSKKEAWRPKCAAPRPVYDSAVFFRDFYARIRTYDVRRYIFGEKEEKKTPPEVRSRNGHVEHVCKISGSTS